MLRFAWRFPAVRISGELRDDATTADSGNHMHRRFCLNSGVRGFQRS
jgi:hypothetical protein